MVDALNRVGKPAIASCLPLALPFSLVVVTRPVAHLLQSCPSLHALMCCAVPCCACAMQPSM
jgi:hypothetical protein